MKTVVSTQEELAFLKQSIIVNKVILPKRKLRIGKNQVTKENFEDFMNYPVDKKTPESPKP